MNDKSGKTCPTSKVRYENEKDCIKAAKDGMLFRGTPSLTAYFCMICYGYHLTSRIDNKKTKRKK